MGIEVQPPLRESPSPRFWLLIGLVALGGIHAAVFAIRVAPYLGPEARKRAEPALTALHSLGAPYRDWQVAFWSDVARRGEAGALPPPFYDQAARDALVVTAVQPDGGAARAALRPGDRILAVADPNRERRMSAPVLGEPLGRLAFQRELYWIPPGAKVELTVTRNGQVFATPFQPTSIRSASSEELRRWITRQGLPIVKIVSYLACAALLVYVRPTDPTAAIVALVLVLVAAGNGGPLRGAEGVFPIGLRELLLLHGFLGDPLSRSTIPIALAFFPRRAPWVERKGWLLFLPVLVNSPEIVLNSSVALFLMGWSRSAGLALHATLDSAILTWTFLGSITALVVFTADLIRRYRVLDDFMERRRVRVVIGGTALGILGFALRSGGESVGWVLQGRFLTYPWWVNGVFQLLEILPALAITYAVAVHRLFGSRVVIRRSLHYALARRTLTALTALPAMLLVLSLIRHRDEPLVSIVTGRASFYAALICASALALHYRERLRIWLDRRFFREVYDARALLLSLAGRVRHEANPLAMADMVAAELEKALHPRMVALLAADESTGQLIAVSARRGHREPESRLGPDIEPLPLASALATFFQWSEEPLELDVENPRSVTSRLPPAEREWLSGAGAVLVVPVLAQDRSLLGLAVLGEKLSEEPYTPEDKQLVSGVATQMGLYFDVARLRGQPVVEASDTELQPTLRHGQLSSYLSECPTCGLCLDGGIRSCPEDGSLMTMPIALPRVLENKYRFDQVIGRGGMGAVYRARDLRLARDVAVKVVRPDVLRDPEALSRFRREAQVLARLQHAGIVGVFDFGTLPGGGAFVIMELVPGESLRSVLGREKALSTDRALPILGSLCAAVDFAHRRGILHRDLKPENVMILGSESGSLVKILDFGLAKLAEPGGGQAVQGDHATEGGAVLGTPVYMAPEQLRGEAVDERTDVFALGVLAFEMLSGEPPYRGRNLIAIAGRQVSGPPALRTPWGDPPSHVERAIRKALEMEPRGRFASAGDFWKALAAGP